MCRLLIFNRTPLRAFVVIPSDEIDRDYCRVVKGGWPIEIEQPVHRGPLAYVIRQLRHYGQGVPITVHPECKRRAAA